LFQQQGCSGAIQSPGSIALQPEAIGGGPGGAIFIDPYQGQGQPLGGQNGHQLPRVTETVASLEGEVLAAIEGQAHNEHLGQAPQGEGGNGCGILLRAAAVQGGQGRDSEAKGVATRQANALAAYIQGKGGAGRLGTHSTLPRWCGQGSGSGLPLIQHRF
jgi:hypothetical protein